MKQLTEQQAVDFHASKAWELMSDENIIEFQLFQDRLCVDFEVFQQSMSRYLERPVYTHEYGSDNIETLQNEFLHKQRDRKLNAHLYANKEPLKQRQ